MVEYVLIKDTLNKKEKIQANHALDFLENIEPNTVNTSAVYVQTEIGKLCYKNNVYDFDIKDNEDILNENLNSLSVTSIDNIEELMDCINNIFIKNILITNEEFKRLSNLAARKFYSMVLSWRTNGSSYKQLIAKFLSYWKKLDTPIIYVGSRWGEIPYGDEFRKTLYVNLNSKSESAKINLAIVRIKEEQDFVDNNLIKYVEILKDLNLLDIKFYERIKYGSSDQNIISLLKNGFSIELAKAISTSIYAPYVTIDSGTDEVHIKNEIIAEMENNNENQILIFEIGYHLQ